MRSAAILGALILAPGASAHAQPGLWAQVEGYTGATPQPGELATPQKQSIAKSIMAHEKAAAPNWGQDCSSSELVDGSTWEMVALSATHNVLLLEAGPCARGGQGANGAMWLVRVDGTAPVILASPAEMFNGWIYSVQPSTSYAYHDIVLGWHMSAAESALRYFRYDGKTYKCIGQATATTDQNEKETITPTKSSCQ